MADIDFTNEEKQYLVEALQSYFSEELDQELGRFEGEFLLDYLAKRIGPLFYNKGLLDARALLDKQMDDYSDALYAMEKPVEPSR